MAPKRNGQEACVALPGKKRATQSVCGDKPGELHRQQDCPPKEVRYLTASCKPSIRLSSRAPVRPATGCQLKLTVHLDLRQRTRARVAGCPLALPYASPTEGLAYHLPFRSRGLGYANESSSAPHARCPPSNNKATDLSKMRGTDIAFIIKAILSFVAWLLLLAGAHSLLLYSEPHISCLHTQSGVLSQAPQR